VGYKYKAFISYSHKDHRWAHWLHRKLEAYRFPHQTLKTHIDIPPNLKPVFRDREELAAGHNLGEKIEAALRQSENLIIICSPHAAKSHWVNQEILFFKRHNRSAKIFSVIIDGTPFAQNQDSECFPEALRFDIDADGLLTNHPSEPLAADLRDSGDGKRLGLLKLYSGMVGLGVNDLIQRDLQRLRKRVMAITVSAAAIVLVMSGLTWTALKSQQEAEKRREDAEGQIEFMLTDLKNVLESVGRLDALAAVGQRAESYYDDYPLNNHDDDALGRRARVFHFLGELQDQYGHLDDAEKYFKRAYNATEALLDRDAENADRVFEHSQSAYWLGYAAWGNKNNPAAKSFWLDYLSLTKKLISLDRSDERAIKEYSYAAINLGVYYDLNEDHKTALSEFLKALAFINTNITVFKADSTAFRNYADLHGWIAKQYSKLGQYSESIVFREKEITALKQYISKTPHIDYQAQYALASAYRNLSYVNYLAGNGDPALNEAERSQKLFSSLVKHEPKNILWQEGKVYLHGLIYLLQVNSGNDRAAQTELAKLNQTLLTLPPNKRKSKDDIINALQINK